MEKKQNEGIYLTKYKNAFRLALVSAKECFNVQEKNINKGYIKCTTKASLWSWGESVLITIKPISSTQTKISIESSASAQLFDWGKSRNNIDNFFNTIEQKLG